MPSSTASAFLRIPSWNALSCRSAAPYWATALLASLPLWAFLYVFSIDQPPAGAHDPIAIGHEVFTPCAGCHGASGAGTATGQQLSDGHVIETFADPLDMVHWIGYGTAEGTHPDGTYGDVNRQPLTGGMAGWRDRLTPEEIAAVTIYIRQELSGGDPTEDPNFNADVFMEQLRIWFAENMPSVETRVIRPRESWVDDPEMRARVAADGDAAIIGVGL